MAGKAVTAWLALNITGWVLIVLVLAGLLAAIVPAGPIVMTSASLLARNVVQALRPGMADRRVFWLTRALVFPLTGAALLITLAFPALIVNVGSSGAAESPGT
jgi:solute:Na+ symporter, SSS family